MSKLPKIMVYFCVCKVVYWYCTETMKFAFAVSVWGLEKIAPVLQLFFFFFCNGGPISIPNIWYNWYWGFPEKNIDTRETWSVLIPFNIGHVNTENRRLVVYSILYFRAFFFSTKHKFCNPKYFTVLSFKNSIFLFMLELWILLLTRVP